MHAVSNALLLQFMGEQVMAVHIELQAERRPCRDTKVTEPQFFVNEIEIIVETFALVKLKECLSRGLVMPGFISIALFHGGKDVDQPLGLSGFLNDLLNPVILAESPKLTNEFDFNAVFICDALGVCADVFTTKYMNFLRCYWRLLTPIAFIFYYIFYLLYYICIFICSI